MAPTPGPPGVGGRVLNTQMAFRYVRMVRASSPDPSMVLRPSEPRPSQVAVGQTTRSRRRSKPMAPTPGPPGVVGRVMTAQRAFRHVRMVRASSPDPSLLLRPSEPRPSQAPLGYSTRSRRKSTRMAPTPGPPRVVRMLTSHRAFRHLRMGRASSPDPSRALRPLEARPPS